jgi:hypothetical protein
LATCAYGAGLSKCFGPKARPRAPCGARASPRPILIPDDPCVPKLLLKL